MIAILVVPLLLAACSAPGNLRPTPPPVTTPGPPREPVGVTARDFEDPARGRRLATTLWYPAAAGTVEEPIFWDGIFPGRAAWNASWRATPARLPLVLLSHGSSGDGPNLAWLAEALASRGYVVAAVDHPGDRFGDSTAAGRFAVWRRPRDVSVVLDALLADPTFAPRIDRRRVAAAGHSAGGFTVLALAGARLRPEAMVAHCRGADAGPDCRLLGDVDLAAFPDLDVARGSHRERRIRAVLAMAPVFGPGVTRTSLRAVTLPVAIAASPSDELVPFASNAQTYARDIRRARLETFPDAGHFVFMPVCSEAGRVIVEQVCVDPSPHVDRAAVHARLIDLAIPFFDRALGVPRTSAEPR